MYTIRTMNIIWEDNDLLADQKRTEQLHLKPSNKSILAATT